MTTDTLGCIMTYCRFSLVFLVCRRWRDLYIAKHKRIRFFLKAMLLNLSTTVWYIVTREQEITDKRKIMIYQYASRHSPINVITYLMNKRYNNKEIYDGLPASVKNIRFPPNFYLMSLDLAKIKWYFSKNSTKRDYPLLFNLRIGCVIKAGRLDILEYLHSIIYRFTYKNLKTAARVDNLDCFKYIRDRLEVIVDKKQIKNLLMACASESKSTKVPHYLLNDLDCKNMFSKDEIARIIDTCVQNGNLELIKCLYSKNIHCRDVGMMAVFGGSVEILNWAILMGIPINKRKAIEGATRHKNSIEKGMKQEQIYLSEKGKSLKYQQKELEVYETDIKAYNECISILETLE